MLDTDMLSDVSLKATHYLFVNFWGALHRSEVGSSRGQIGIVISVPRRKVLLLRVRTVLLGLFIELVLVWVLAGVCSVFEGCSSDLRGWFLGWFRLFKIVVVGTVNPVALRVLRSFQYASNFKSLPVFDGSYRDIINTPSSIFISERWLPSIILVGALYIHDLAHPLYLFLGNSTLLWTSNPAVQQLLSCLPYPWNHFNGIYFI